jgi:hypothetical protein
VEGVLRADDLPERAILIAGDGTERKIALVRSGSAIQVPPGVYRLRIHLPGDAVIQSDALKVVGGTTHRLTCSVKGQGCRSR